MIHTCHARGCKVAVPPRLLMCKRHWFMVPKPLRDQVWSTYRPGQEVDKRPTGEYLDAADAAIKAVYEKELAKLRSEKTAQSSGPVVRHVKERDPYRWIDWVLMALIFGCCVMMAVVLVNPRYWFPS